MTETSTESHNRFEIGDRVLFAGSDNVGVVKELPPNKFQPHYLVEFKDRNGKTYLADCVWYSLKYADHDDSYLEMRDHMELRNDRN